MKLLDENIGKSLQDMGMAMIFWLNPQIKQITKAKIDQWDYIKLRSFCTRKQ
jgi:hypothetical protein